jgi:hypothetical protein
MQPNTSAHAPKATDEDEWLGSVLSACILGILPCSFLGSLGVGLAFGVPASVVVSGSGVSAVAGLVLGFWVPPVMYWAVRSKWAAVVGTLLVTLCSVSLFVGLLDLLRNAG